MYRILLPLCLLVVLSDIRAQGVINKCLVNGKIIYSDQKCPKVAVREQVEMHHASGIVSPDRATVDDTIQRMYDERWVEAEPGRAITRTTSRQGTKTTRKLENPRPQHSAARRAPDKKSICANLARRVAHLDARARQPQSTRTQERIKEQKVEVQARAFDAGC